MNGPGDEHPPFDPQTLDYYQREAAAYGAHRGSILYPALSKFMGILPKGAAVLELGCGGGQDAELMLRAGLDLTVTDGAPAMCDVAARRLQHPVLPMRFDQLNDVMAFDGVWANACLLHVPEAALPAIIHRIYRSLRPSGVFCATFEGGALGSRDALDRYFNYISASQLRSLVLDSAPWTDVEVESHPGRDFLGARTEWLVCWAHV